VDGIVSWPIRNNEKMPENVEAFQNLMDN